MLFQNKAVDITKIPIDRLIICQGIDIRKIIVLGDSKDIQDCFKMGKTMLKP